MGRVLRIVLLSVLGIAALLGGLYFWFIYTPIPPAPHLSGTLEHGSIAVRGRTRTYLTYVPKELPKGAPLVIALHGSGEDGARMRFMTAYGFDRLADERGFAIAYPDGYEGYWNGCGVAGDFSANRLDIDDVGFLTALTEKLVSEIGGDPDRVYAVGVSRGGAMAIRLALDAPQHFFSAVAVVSESVPTPDNFKCKPPSTGTPSVLIMNGTRDPIIPFEGGEVSLFGVFLRRGTVLSTRASGEYFVRLNGMTGNPNIHETKLADGFGVEETLWHGANDKTVEVLAIEGGGHGLPQPFWRYPRILGPTATAFDGPKAIWDFFALQARQ